MEGAVVDPAGLDVEELVELRARHGDRLVEHGPGPARPRQEIFELACDVLVPGARPDSVTVELAERGDWAVVAPGANVPYQAGSLPVLARRGIVAVPDFVSNSGGVHLYESVHQDADPAAAVATIGRLVRDSVARILARADAEGMTPTAAALAESRAYLAEETGAGEDALDELFAA
jgi:glutamate dehydrogenase/leucine dehydrogenase